MSAPSMLILYAGLMLFLAFAFIASVASAVLMFRKLGRRSPQNASRNSDSAHEKADASHLFEGIDFSGGVSDEELELIRQRAAEAAAKQFQAVATKKIRALLQ